VNAVARTQVKSGELVPNVPVVEGATLLAVISRAAADPNTDVEKMERLMAMYERIEAKNAERAFNEAMNACQKAMRPISADAENPQTHSKYATFAKLDGALRPIYTQHGFSLSYDEGDSPKAEHVRVLCYVAHNGGFTRTYHRDMPADGKGARGNDVMTKTHAAGAAGSYGARYLLKGIFNVAVGEEDKDGNDNSARAADDAVANPLYDKMDLAASVAELQKVKPEITTAKVQAATKRNLIAAYNGRLRKLQGAAA
jgi:hypothetical protein